MSSLYKPFSVSDGPCTDAILRQGCRSQQQQQQQQQHPAGLTSIPPSCLGGVVASKFAPIHHVCAGKRSLAAAAVGGRKVTHPGKAIFAGKMHLIQVKYIEMLL